MKRIKFLAFTLSFILLCCIFTGCSKNTTPQPVAKTSDSPSEKITPQPVEKPEMTEEEKRLSELNGYLKSIGHKIEDTTDFGEKTTIRGIYHYYILNFSYNTEKFDANYFIIQEMKSPYRIYRAYENSESFLVWKDGKPMTDEQELMEELAPTLEGMDTESKYKLITETRACVMTIENWRDLGELNPDCQDIVYISERKNFYQIQYENNIRYIYIHGRELNTSDDEWYWVKG